METRTVHDPFVGEDVQISNRLVDRLRGKYATGPHLPNGLPEFGWRQFQATPINLEAADRIEALEKELADLKEGRTAIIPCTREHAEKLFTVANACLNGNEHIEGFRKRGE